MAVFFVIIKPRGDDMNITKLIKSNEELKDLPFLVVFRTIQVLREKGLMRDFDEGENVDRIQS
jgi:hypothetical protein